MVDVFLGGRGSMGNVELHVMTMMCWHAHDLPKIVRVQGIF